MEYNSQKEILVMPEYGRVIQDLIRHTKTIDDEKKRQAYAVEVVELMHNINPQSKNIDESKEKLWKHLFKIAEYDLDVKPPNMDVPKEEDDRKRPQKVEYPSSEAKFKHYGNHVQRMIMKALEMDEGPVRDGFAITIASYMKMAYKTWSHEHFAGDNVILEDLKTLSNGKLVVDENANISGLADNAQRNTKKNENNMPKKGKSRKGRSRRRRRKNQ